MDEEVAAFIVDVAPGDKRAEWNQKGLRRTLKNWEQTRPADYNTVRKSTNFGIVVGFQIAPLRNERGQYGYDTGFHFESDIEEDHLSDVEGGHLAHDFYDDWVEAIQGVIEEEQEQTLFSPKEYATFFAHRHPFRNERRNADGLKITVGTFRGKVGRVKSKLEEARATVGIEESLPADSEEEWSGQRYSAHPSVICRVDESDLPIQSVWSLDSRLEEYTLDDLPLDQVLQE